MYCSSNKRYGDDSISLNDIISDIENGLKECSVDYMKHNNLVFVIDNKYAATEMICNTMKNYCKPNIPVLIGSILRPGTFSSITLYEGLLFSFEDIVKSNDIRRFVNDCEINRIKDVYNHIKVSHIQSLPNYKNDMVTLSEGRYEYMHVLDDMFKNQVNFKSNLTGFFDLFKHYPIIIPIDMDNYYETSEIRKIIKLFNHENIMILFYNCYHNIKQEVYDMS